MLLPISEVKVLRVDVLSQQDDRVDPRERSTIILDAPCEKHFSVAALVVHIATSADDLTLSVVTDDDTAVHLHLFDLRTFASQVGVEIVTTSWVGVENVRCVATSTTTLQFT